MTPVAPRTTSRDASEPRAIADTDTDADAVARRIIDAATEILAEGGLDALTVRAIADRAGGSTMLVYSRFGGKDGVVEAIFVEGFDRLRHAIERARRSRDPLVDLGTCARAYRRFALDNPTLYQVMFERDPVSCTPGPVALAAAERSFGALIARVQRAVDAGVVVGPAISSATVIWAANHGAVALELHGVAPAGVDWERSHRSVIRAVLAGLAP